jgi:hypothetical protein
MPGPSLTDQKLEWVGLGSILSQHSLQVPVYQRAYSWTRVEVADFWKDLTGSMERREDEYFMGPVVVAAAEGPDRRMTVIDGQQRLATASILLAVLRDRLYRLGDVETQQDVQRLYLGSPDLRTRTVTPRLLLSEEDRRFFASLISEIPDPTRIPRPIRASHRRIGEAREHFESELDGLHSRIGGELRELIVDLIEFLRDRVIVMLASVPEESDAYAIFETLNARGLELAIADLLKNHLFSEARGSLEEVRHFWNLAMSNISQVDERAVTDFLRHLWNSRHDLARERELYRVFKPEIQNERDAQTFATDLESASRDYVALLSPGHERWRDLGPQVEAAAQNLFDLGLEQNRPMLLAAMQTMEDEDLGKLLKWLVSWSVRGLVVGGIGKGQTEITYGTAARAIREGRVKSITAIFRELEGIIPTDTAFAASFRAYSPPNRKRSHYLLRALERGLKRDTEPYVIPNPDPAELTLEHVLPMNPKRDQWPAFTPEQIDEYTGRLGNLALVTRRRNQALGNRPFSEKRSTYAAATDIELTSSIASYEKWTPAAVEDRQAKMANVALQVWPRSP